jgi:CPA1 family monovalent cation:H+ antiporter
MLSPFDLGALIFLFAATVGYFNDRHFHLPRPIALLLGALLVSLLIILVGALFPALDIRLLAQRRIAGAHLPHVLLDGVLALLLFAAALHVDLRELRSQAWAVFGLATVGVILASLLFAAGIWVVFRLDGIEVPLIWCFVLGAVLAPTDAIAVDDLLKRAGLPAGLKALISGESLFNDGTAVVLFFAALAAADGEPGVVGHGRIIIALLTEGTAGAALGAGLAYFAGFVIRRVSDDNLTLTISVASALAAYRLATAFGWSGPIAAVVCGIVLASLRLDSQGRLERRRKLVDFWAFLDELLNTFLFIILGFEILNVAGEDFALLPAIMAVILALAARLLSVCALTPLLPRGWDRRKPVIAVLTWVGLRGGISLALVLNLPDNEWRGTLAAVCYVVVIFSIVAQGLLTPRVIASFYGAKPDAEPIAVGSRRDGS